MTDATANRVAPWLDDGDLQLYHGDALTVLQGLPAGIAQTCVTSPPFFDLRDYGVDGQLGLERTLGEFLERLLAVFAEVWRVLRADGTAWVEIGDTYAAKGLMGVPWAFAFAMRDAGWLLRSDIVWSRPNPMPESVTDRPTKSHSYLLLFSKQPRYYFDQDAIREPSDDKQGRVIPDGHEATWVQAMNGQHATGRIDDDGGKFYGAPAAGRNRRSVWTIPTQPFPEAHFATYPEELVRPCILAGSRIGDLVLDPFIGSGTTSLVARKHGRRSIGIDLSAEYLAIAAKRTQQLSLLGGVA